MAALVDRFEEMKSFVGFGAADVENLKSLAPTFAARGPAITDAFYGILGNFPATAAQIEGRIDALKATHARWMGELFAGDYGEAYFNNRLRIGQAHVRIGLDPQYVEGVMSILRAAGLEAIMADVSDPTEAKTKYESLLKILDLDLVIINLAYGEERLDRVSSFTGMSRRLIETVIKKAGDRK